MDVLSCSLDKKVVTLNFTNLYYGNAFVSHLFFADDILIFGQANSNTTLSLNKVSDNLAMTAELEINRARSIICFSKNSNEATQLRNLLNIPFGAFSIRYLGIPLQMEISKLQISTLFWTSFMISLLDGNLNISHLGGGYSSLDPKAIVLCPIS